SGQQFDTAGGETPGNGRIKRFGSCEALHICCSNSIRCSWQSNRYRPCRNSRMAGGGNATGFSDVLADLTGKHVDFAGQLNGAHAAVHYLWHTAWPDGQHRYKATEQAVQSVGKELRSRGITDIAEADDAFAALKSGGVKVIIIQPSPFTYRHRNRLISSAQVQGLGTIFGWPQTGRER